MGKRGERLRGLVCGLQGGEHFYAPLVDSAIVACSIILVFYAKILTDGFDRTAAITRERSCLENTSVINFSQTSDGAIAHLAI